MTFRHDILGLNQRKYCFVTSYFMAKMRFEWSISSILRHSNLSSIVCIKGSLRFIALWSLNGFVIATILFCSQKVLICTLIWPIVWLMRMCHETPFKKI